MTDLLESLDSAIFTPELQADIQAKFAAKIVEVQDSYNLKLEESATVLAEKEALIESLTAKHEEEVLMLKEQANAYASELLEQEKEKANKYGEFIAEEQKARAQEYVEYVKKELSESVQSYMDLFVEEYLKENRIAIDESIEVEKVKAMLEGLDSIVGVTGVSVAELQESISVKTPDVVADMEVLKAKLDSVLKENSELKKAIKDSEKSNIVESVAKELTLVQRDKFDRLAALIPFNESYKASLEKIVKEICIATETQEPVVEATVIVEDTKIEEKSYSRFL